MSSLTRKEMLRRTIESLEASCKAHPGNQKLQHQLALAWYKAGRFDADAQSFYEEMSRRFPQDVKLQSAVAACHTVRQGQAILRDVPSLEDIDPDALSRSLERLREMSEHYPDSPDIHRALGDITLIQGEYRDALKEYRAAMALGLTDLEGICDHFQRMQALFPLPPNVVAFFAELYQRMGRMDEAAALYRNLIEEGEDDPETLEAYYRFLQRRISLLQDDPKAMNAAMRETCEVALMMGRTEEALSWARQLSPAALTKIPRLVKKLGRLLIDKEDFRQAFDYLSKIELDSESKALLNEIAVKLEQRGELDTAVYLLQFINEHDQLSLGEGVRGRGGNQNRRPQRGDDWEIEINTELQLAELHWKSRRWKQAFESYLKVLEMGFDDYRSLLEPLDSLLERLPDIDEKHLAFLANFFAEKRDWRRTLFYAERALFLDPNLDDIRQRLIQACEQILLQDPDSCEVRLKLGDVMLDKGNFERAMKEYRKVSTYPEFGMKANRRIAVALFRAGDHKAAFLKFQDLPVLETEDLEHLYDLMIAFQNAEQWKLAVEAATLIKDYDPRFRDTSAKIDQYEKKLNAAGHDLAIDPKMRELIGDHSIGRYRYMEKIGSGGMGVVHKVLDLKTNMEVAMKILREGLSGSDKAIDRFFREARIAATLHHRNIVQILDYNISNFYGQSYIAMEFVDGPSLRDIVEEKFSQTVDVDMQYVLEVCDWIMQTCEALDATHHKGIIHRDIKPDNIMLDSTGLIKLTDFGIVHIEEATFTPTGALIGTPRYMSPEQVHGGRIDARSDIYSVGIILYEMLIGSPPFISGDISYQQVNVLPTPPREICGSIPEAIDAITMRCLEKNPSDRYQSSLDLRAGLEEAFVRLGGDPKKLQHSTTSDATTDGHTARRHQSAETVDLPRFNRFEPPSTVGPSVETGATGARHSTWSSEEDFENELDLDIDETDRLDRLVPSEEGFRPLPSPAEAPAGHYADPERDSLDEMDLPEEFRNARKAAKEDSIDEDMDLSPVPPGPLPSLRRPRPSEDVAGLFDSEIDLGENAEEDETAPVKIGELHQAAKKQGGPLPSPSEIRSHPVFETKSSPFEGPLPEEEDEFDDLDSVDLE